MNRTRTPAVALFDLNRYQQARLLEDSSQPLVDDSQNEEDDQDMLRVEHIRTKRNKCARRAMLDN